MNNDFNKHIIEPLLQSIELYSDRNAFCINKTFYTYKQLGESISKIQSSIKKLVDSNIHFGLVINDDIETYASIYALWLEGKAYIPLHPDQPLERNMEIISQVGIENILDSSNKSMFSSFKVIHTLTLSYENEKLDYNTKISDTNLAYILFTSGSTGKPKGVPITRSNLAGFTNAFWELGIELNETDKCLQMFELTFDLSVMSYLVPLLKGASIFTIPKDEMKFVYISDLMEDHGLTFSLMVPSMLNYLRPYFDEMSFPEMRYSLFCGEALPLDIAKEWSQVLPNADILNVYGPTEDTIFCTSYKLLSNEDNKSYNGVLSVGKEMQGTKIVTIDSNNNILPPNEKGELCLSGVQLTPGYWKNPVKNQETFFVTDYNGIKTRFYKTGDICIIDENSDILYIGRLDSQTKVQGFRVELSEIEHYTREFLIKKNIAILAFKNQLGNTEIGLAIEGDKFNEKDLLSFLKNKIPAYMLPTKIRFIEQFPQNLSGKVDKNVIREMFI